VKDLVKSFLMKFKSRQYNSSTKVIFFLVTVSFAFLLTGYHFGGRFGLLASFIITVLFHLTLFFFGKTKILEHLNAKEISGQDPWGLVELVMGYADDLDIIPPSIYVSETPQVFAFTVNQDSSLAIDSIIENSKENSIICFSTGLLNRLKRKEVESIVARQVTQAAYMNTFSRNIAHIFAFSILGLGSFLDHFWVINILKSSLSKQNKHNKQKPFSSILSPLAWLILKLPFSEQIYFDVDETTARLTNDRYSLAEALWKLEGYAAKQNINPPIGTHQYFAVNPFGLREKNWFLLTHPKIDNRIQKLLGYFPL
jgi:heat shock protein HtpX